MLKAYRQKDGSYVINITSSEDNNAAKILNESGAKFDREKGYFICSEKLVSKVKANKMFQVSVGPFGLQPEVFPLVPESKLSNGNITMTDNLTGKKHEVKINRILGEPFKGALGFK